MKAIPLAKNVRLALKATDQAAKAALKALNKAAGTQMAKGDYDGAEGLAARGRQIQEFQARLVALRKEWSEIQRGSHGKASPSGQKTPLWAYYQPILRALIAAGGEARRSELEPTVRHELGEALKPGDEDMMAHGQARWQVMIRRARRPMTKEGWLEALAGSTWRITDAGRTAATKGARNIGRSQE